MVMHSTAACGGATSRRLIGALAALTVFAAACSGGDDKSTQTATATAPAEAARTAVSVATVAVVRTTPAVSAPRGGTVNINALYFRRNPRGEAEGGTSKFKVTVAEKKEPGIRVSFSESEVGGQGTAIRAAGWTAATATSLLLGIDPSRLAFNYEISGRVDGPSAGALMTIGTLAAVLGDTMPADLAMTGTINPDGSIGPVGGIPHKIDGAAKAGFKTVLVPGAQRFDWDANLKQSVDLVKRGEEQGVQVKLVKDIFEAYQLATGKVLPQPKATGQPQTPSRVYDKTRAATAAWLAKYSDARGRYDSYSRVVRNHFDIETSEYWAEQARKSEKEGAANVALERAITAARSAMTANQAAMITQTYLDRGISAAAAQADASTSARSTVKAMLERLKAEQPKTASDAISLMDAYSYYVIAEAQVRQGDAQLKTLVSNISRMDEDEVLDSILALSDSFATAEVFVEMTRNGLDRYQGQGSIVAPSLDVLTGLAEILRRSAEANVAAFDASVIRDAAESAGVRDEVVKARLAANDGYYDMLISTIDTLGIETDRQGQPRVYQVYYTLGGALNAYALSTLMLSKYYSLDAELDDDYSVTGFGRETALTAMLQLAERRAEELLAVSQEPVLAGLYYLDNAKAYRNGDNNAKMDALFYYWTSTVLGQLLANMTGEYGQQVQAGLQGRGAAIEFIKANSWKP